MSEIIPILFGGLILFIYAIFQLSASLRELFTEKAKQFIARYTSHILAAILVGTILTVLLDSSSAVIILVIIFINARTLTFRQAIGIIMGANIGTTFSSQIFALSFAKYSIIPLAIGLIMVLFIRRERIKKYGAILLFFGMLFFGLYLMEQSVYPLRDSKLFEQWIAQVESKPLRGTLIGGLITLILQSSGATVGIAIVLGKQKMITAAGGIAIMLGAELGTCSDTLIATIKGTRQALKAGLFHLFFNLTTIILGLIVFGPFVDLVQKISSDMNIGHQIANAHMLFNVLGVLIFLPFARLTERFLNWMIPEKVRANGI